MKRSDCGIVKELRIGLEPRFLYSFLNGTHVNVTHLDLCEEKQIFEAKRSNRWYRNIQLEGFDWYTAYTQDRQS